MGDSDAQVVHLRHSQDAFERELARLRSRALAVGITAHDFSALLELGLIMPPDLLVEETSAILEGTSRRSAARAGRRWSLQAPPEGRCT